MLDHASATGNPNLQRWSAATLKNLIFEDQRRACLAVNEIAAFVASGETVPYLSWFVNVEVGMFGSTSPVILIFLGFTEDDNRNCRSYNEQYR
jgi:hypothetical protein